MPNDRYKAGKPWTCNSCSRRFRLSRGYAKALGWGTIGLTLILSYILGLRGVALALATVVMWSPVMLICTYSTGWCLLS
jgi:hypothetical protein